MRIRFVLATLMLLSTAGIAGSCEPPVEAPHPRQEAQIRRLIADLDSGDFQTRDAATTALTRIGEPALPLLPPAEQFSPETNARIRRIREEIRRNPVRETPSGPVQLDDLLREARRAQNKSWTPECLEMLLTRLVETVSLATGKDDLRLPVRFAKLQRARQYEAAVRSGLSVVQAERIGTVQNSVIVAESVADITLARNSVILADCAVRISLAENCIILGGSSVFVPTAKDCLVLSGSQAWLATAENSVVGAHDQLSLADARMAIIVNSRADAAMLAAERQLNLDDLVLRSRPHENPLGGVIRLTTAVPGKDIALFRRADGSGEYVARSGEPIRFPDGTPMAELEGWTVYYVGPEFAVFRNRDRQVYLGVE